MRLFQIIIKSSALSLLLLVLALIFSAPEPMNAAGIASGTQLTKDGGLKQGTDWSPDGKWIAYGLKGEIYLVPAQGGTPVNATASLEYECVNPHFSSDSKQIFFTYMPTGTTTGEGSIMTVKGVYKPDSLLTGEAKFKFATDNSQGKKNVSVTFDFAAANLHFVSDAGSVPDVFADIGGFFDIFTATGTLNGKSGYLYEICGWGESDINPSGHFVMSIMDKDNKYIYNNWDGFGNFSNASVVTSGKLNFNHLQSSMSVEIDALLNKTAVIMPNASQGIYSSDGKYFVYRENTSDLLKVYDTQSKTAKNILQPDDLFWWTHSAFSADGTQVYATVMGADGIFKFFKVPRAGGNSVRLTKDFPGIEWRPDTSPDGKWVLFETFKDVGYYYTSDGWVKSYLLEVATGKVTPVFPDDFYSGGASFSPDGKKICYLRQADPAKNDFDLYVTDFTSPTVTQVQENESIPAVFNLYQNSPNPFNPSTTIQYSLPAGIGHLNLNIYDMRGALVRTLAGGNAHPGRYSVVWDGKDMTGKNVSSGMYVYRLKAGAFTESRKMLLMR
jgi:Tol biopolymer transport system component